MILNIYKIIMRTMILISHRHWSDYFHIYWWDECTRLKVKGNIHGCFTLIGKIMAYHIEYWCNEIYYIYEHIIEVYVCIWNQKNVINHQFFIDDCWTYDDSTSNMTASHDYKVSLWLFEQYQIYNNNNNNNYYYLQLQLFEETKSWTQW